MLVFVVRCDCYVVDECYHIIEATRWVIDVSWNVWQALMLCSAVNLISPFAECAILVLILTCEFTWLWMIDLWKRAGSPNVDALSLWLSMPVGRVHVGDHLYSRHQIHQMWISRLWWNSVECSRRVKKRFFDHVSFLINFVGFTKCGAWSTNEVGEWKTSCLVWLLFISLTDYFIQLT